MRIAVREQLIFIVILYVLYKMRKSYLYARVCKWRHGHACVVVAPGRCHVRAGCMHEGSSPCAGDRSGARAG